MHTYEQFAGMLGFPVWFKYYGPLAAFLEMFYAVAIWFKPTQKTAAFLMLALLSVGIVISGVSMWLKLNSECGCGLFGESELSYLIQKVILIAGVLYIHRKQNNAMTLATNTAITTPN